MIDTGHELDKYFEQLSSMNIREIIEFELEQFEQIMEKLKLSNERIGIHFE